MEGNRKNAQEQEKGQQNHISLIFIVNGKATTVEKVNIHQPLHVSAQKALEQTGNTGRPLSDYQVKYNDTDISTGAKVEDLGLQEGAKIFLSLKVAEGGSR